MSNPERKIKIATGSNKVKEERGGKVYENETAITFSAFATGKKMKILIAFNSRKLSSMRRSWRRNKKNNKCNININMYFVPPVMTCLLPSPTLQIGPVLYLVNTFEKVVMNVFLAGRVYSLQYTRYKAISNTITTIFRRIENRINICLFFIS
jgi:hypothetical protein